MLPTVPTFIQRLFPHLLWRYADDRKVYLTFDDGPVPEATPWVLDILKDNDVKATFFCVGENVAKYPDIYQRILDEGHTVGNHTYNHFHGWKTSTESYVDNIERAAELIDSRLFRPPYGKMTPQQTKAIEQKGYKTVMWDVLTMDYDKNKSPEDCFKTVQKHTKPGSIIVCHDSIKAIETLKVLLPRIITYCRDQNWVLTSM